MILLSPPLAASLLFYIVLLSNIHPRLETLLRDLSLGRGDGLGGVGVDEATALLAILELGPDARADAGALAVVGAATLLAVGVVDAASGRELASVAVADVACSRGVGDSLGADGHGDWAVSAFRPAVRGPGNILQTYEPEGWRRTECEPF